MEKKHTGGCHCGKVRYEVELDATAEAVECNCSHCAVKGLLFQFVPAEKFTLTSGEDETTEYRFNKHHIDHRFCSTCGVQPFGQAAGPDGTMMVAVNIRTIDGIDLDTVPRKKVDGKSF